MNTHSNCIGNAKAVYFIFVLLVLLSSTVFAQQITGDIVGTVTDQSGAAIAGADVTVTNLGTQVTRTMKANSEGQFVFALLQVGQYSVSIDFKGFRTFQRTKIPVTVGSRVRVDAVLTLGEVNENVEVQTQATVLQTDTSTLQSTLGEKAVNQLPLNGRNYQQLAQLAPGVNEGTAHSSLSANDPRPFTTSIVVNAQSELQNNFMIDGMDNNDRIWGLSGVRPSVDAVQEVNVLTGQYTADVGRTAGGVINVVTKSGTDTLHGTVYDFLRNNVFDAKDPFQPAGTTAPFRQNQFGASIGGPILKKKTFFFADYEGLRSLQATPTLLTVPTTQEQTVQTDAGGRYYDFSDRGEGKVYLDNNPKLSPAALNYYRLFPRPTYNGLYNNYVSQQPITRNGDAFDVRIDQQFTDRTSLFGRYSYNNNDRWTPGQLPAVSNFVTNLYTSIQQQTIPVVYPAGALDAPATTQGFQVNFTHAFSASTLLEVVGGYNYINIHTKLGNQGPLGHEFGIPNANLDDMTTGLPVANLGPFGFPTMGDQSFNPNIIKDSTTQVMATLSQVRGKHSLKFGGSFLYGAGNQFQNRWGTGMYIFAGPAGSISAFLGGWGPFPGGTPITGLRANLMQVQDLRTHEPSFFAQDNWRVTPKLTLNLGLRYSVFTPFTEKNNNISSFDPNTGKINYAGKNGVSNTAGIQTDWGNVAPRIGFAFTAWSNTVIRGGYAISYFQDMSGAGIYLKNSPEEISWSGGNGMDVGMPAPVVPTSNAQITGALTGIDPNYKASYAEQYSISVQQEIKKWVATVGYIGILTRRMAMDMNINQTAPGIPPSTIFNPVDQQKRYATAPYYSLYPNVTENIQLLMSAGHQNYNALQASLDRRAGNLVLSANYTLAHALSDVMSMDGRSMSSGWGNCTQNAPWTSLVAQVAQNDYGNSDFDVRQRVAIGASYQIPFGKNLKGVAGVLGKGWSLNGIYSYTSGLPFSVLTGVNGGQLGTNTSPPNNQDRAWVTGSWNVSNPSPTGWFNTNAFTLQNTGVVTNQERNQLRGPSFRHLDVSLGKQFNLTETWGLQFRVETFNVTNTPNWGDPVNALGPTLGTISATRFGPREIQFALKLMF